MHIGTVGFIDHHNAGSMKRISCLHFNDNSFVCGVGDDACTDSDVDQIDANTRIVWKHDQESMTFQKVCRFALLFEQCTFERGDAVRACDRRLRNERWRSVRDARSATLSTVRFAPALALLLVTIARATFR
jgi:hypothetical protein